MTDKVTFVNKASPRKPFYPLSGPKSSPSLLFGNSSQNAPKSKPPGENKGHNPLSQAICNYCKQSGHIVSDCPVLKRKWDKQEGLKPTGLTSLKLTPQSALVLRIKTLSRSKYLRLILLWRFMNHSYQMVLCHKLVTFPSKPLSYEIPELLLNLLFWQIPCHFPRRLFPEQVFLLRV